ncbi:hypothetical protein T458_16110 [Brevibacillus panacihumi W25]|uniref:Uncharacterized protein n=1 Tax=Brevibacillus panacihumi W25 TaxID=1408254 RepID=V6M5D4_9BACL|nr:hypothetical protein T458_16110 [Brevibacillus panacihumi W25]
MMCEQQPNSSRLPFYNLMQYFEEKQKEACQ